MLVSEGEIAYGAYRACMESEGNKVPRWWELTETECMAWQHAANECISVHVAACLA